MNDKNITSLLFAFIMAIMLLSTSCKKEEVPTNDIKIVKMEASRNTIQAWDTTTVKVQAVGNNLVYQWSSDEGTIVKAGADSIIHFTACETCIGTRVITCKVSNKTGFVLDTIQIHVTSYFR